MNNNRSNIGLVEGAPTYQNQMRSSLAHQILGDAAQRGLTILDVGGGMAPFARATKILDVLPYDPERLRRNAWGGDRPHSWTAENYVEFDCCERRWPFPDATFDVGCALGMLEDIRDPIFAARELQRVCRRVLIEMPSRLCEQTFGIEHQCWPGFWHHRWMVYADNGTLVFQHKTPVLQLRGCHHTIWPWQRLDGLELIFTFVADSPFPVIERAFWFDAPEYEDLKGFVARTSLPPRRLETDWRRIVYRFRQLLGSAI